MYFCVSIRRPAHSLGRAAHTAPGHTLAILQPAECAECARRAQRGRSRAGPPINQLNFMFAFSLMYDFLFLSNIKNNQQKKNTKINFFARNFGFFSVFIFISVTKRTHTKIPIFFPFFSSVFLSFFIRCLFSSYLVGVRWVSLSLCRTCPEKSLVHFCVTLFGPDRFFFRFFSLLSVCSDAKLGL